MKLKLLLLDDNQMFVENFEDYIFEKFNSDFDVYVYTNSENLLLSEQNNKYDVLLVNANFYSDVKDKLDINSEILLTTGNIPAEYSELNCLNKYMPADDLINEIQRLYMKDNSRVFTDQGEKGTQIISFFSPVGGSGKTTASIVFSNLLAKEGKKVLYIPLEFMIGDELLFGADKGFDITYLFVNTANKNSLKFELNKIKSTNEKTGLDYLPGFAMPKDYYAVDEKSWTEVLNLLETSLDYDYVVFDLIHSYDQTTIQILNRSDKVILVASKGYVEGFKFSKAIAYLSEYGKVEYLYDKSLLLTNTSKNTSSSSNIDESKFTEDFECGFDSSLKQVVEGQVVYNMDSIFARELMAMVFSQFL